MDSVFNTYSLDRSESKWEDHLGDLTPWEDHYGIWFKREDKFAPLNYGGPNGSKLRQLIWLINRQREGKTHIVTGASVQSPQLSMSAIVGAHYGLPSRQVVYSKPETVLSHPNPAIAHGFGATFEYALGPYNPIIQRKVYSLVKPDSLLVEYGITVDHMKHDPEVVRKFHEVGANQVSNVPSEVRRLIVPAGSCNTLASVLLGLSKDSKNIAQLFTVGIGPDKTDWLRARMSRIGVDIDKLPFDWRHVSLHDTGYSKYSDHFNNEAYDGIEFHPTYEAKIWRWLREHDNLTHNGKTAMWIVGSAPKLSVIKPFFTHMWGESV